SARAPGLFLGRRARNRRRRVDIGNPSRNALGSDDVDRLFATRRRCATGRGANRSDENRRPVSTQKRSPKQVRQEMNKFLFGMVWFVLFYFGACVVAGTIAGTVAASRLPRNSPPQRVREATLVASGAMVYELRLYLFSGALIIAGV